MMMIRSSLPKATAEDIEKGVIKILEAEEKLVKKTKFVVEGGPYGK
jgi:hypothetical protein